MDISHDEYRFPEGVLSVISHKNCHIFVLACLLLQIANNIFSNELNNCKHSYKDKITSPVIYSFGNPESYLEFSRKTLEVSTLDKENVRLFYQSGFAPFVYYQDITTSKAIAIATEKLQNTEQSKKEIHEIIRPIIKKWQRYQIVVPGASCIGIMYWYESKIYIIGFWVPDPQSLHFSKIKYTQQEIQIIKNVLKYVSVNKFDFKVQKPDGDNAKTIEQNNDF